jgi:HPt (histidine-containing phosphotransfer) domain-containing protein
MKGLPLIILKPEHGHEDCQSMNSSPPSNDQAARPQALHAKWTPPAWLLEVASSDDSLIADLIDVFKTSTQASLQQMRTALATVDVPRLRNEAHKIKGSAKQVGADALAEVCQTLELASSLTPLSRLGEPVGCCHELFAETESAMTSYSNDIKAGVHTAPPLS